MLHTGTFVTLRHILEKETVSKENTMCIFKNKRKIEYFLGIVTTFIYLYFIALYS